MKTRRFAYSSALGLLLSNCTVYAPMQPVMLLVSQRGQGKVAASLHLPAAWRLPPPTRP